MIIKLIKSENKSNISGFNYNSFKLKNTNKLLIFTIFLFLLFLISLFKNISYPLFWEDESMTAIGSERVLDFGYPKVHDGKNVFYELQHSDPKLGINEKDDAYIGGSGWGNYYFGTIGYKIAEKINNIYLKTGLYRSTFAVIGLIGLLLIAFFMTRFFHDKFTKFAFLSLFLLLELMSISLVLLLREVRYYSMVIFLSCLIMGLYANFRFYKRFNKILFIVLESIGLWFLFITFSPVYFITILTIGLSELVIVVYKYFKHGILASIKDSLPAILSLIISFAGVCPLLSYFKTFEISKALNEFNNYNSEMYFENLNTVFNYFKNFDFLLLAIILKIIIIFNIKKLLVEKPSIFKVSNFFTLFFVISIFAIVNIPNFAYTRYFIFLQPFLSIIIILDFFTILRIQSTYNSKFRNFKILVPIVIFLGMFIYTLINNFNYIKGHIYEMSHRYKGPLDYTIPYILKIFPKTDTLIIAANYEESSYMYYLKSKVIIGFCGNNLLEDSKLNPHIIAYRKPWGNYEYIFRNFVENGAFKKVGFPVYDNCVNNIPELNFKPAFNHLFISQSPDSKATTTYLYIRKYQLPK